MEAVAMDKLVEKGDLSPRVARAIAEALDITIKAANLATAPMMDARFAQQDAKMEARFCSIERSLERTKVWATLLYAGLAAAGFGGLAVDHRWLVSREDRLMAQMQARSDARFAQSHAQSDARFALEEAHTDRLLVDDHARIDRLIAEQQANLKQAEVRTDAKLDQLRALLINRTLNPGGTIDTPHR